MVPYEDFLRVLRYFPKSFGKTRLRGAGVLALSVDITAALWEVRCRERQKVIRGYQTAISFDFVGSLWPQRLPCESEARAALWKRTDRKEAGEEGFAHCASVNGLIKTNALRLPSQRTDMVSRNQSEASCIRRSCRARSSSSRPRLSAVLMIRLINRKKASPHLRSG